MKILLSWLNDFAHFADVDDAEAVAAIASDLTSLGLAVEEVVPTGRGVDGVVSARVLRVETHPDAPMSVRHQRCQSASVLPLASAHSPPQAIYSIGASNQT